MAPQTSLFKVFSVGQITSIKCCPHAAQQRKEKKGKGEGGTKTESRRDRRVWPQFSQRSLSYSHTHSLSHSPRTPARLFLNIIIRGLDNCPRRTTDPDGGGVGRAVGRTDEKCNGICLEASIWRYVL